MGEKKKGQRRPPTTSWPGDVPAPSGPGKVFNCITRETLERTPFLWAIGFIPISQEMKYRLMIGKKKKKLQLVWTGPHIVVLANLIAVRVIVIIP